MLRSVVVDARRGRGHLEDDADLLVVHIHAPYKGQDNLPLQGVVGALQAGADSRREFAQAAERVFQLRCGDVRGPLLRGLLLERGHALSQPC